MNFDLNTWWVPGRNTMIGLPLVTFLQEEFGYQGATLILGGITLNLFVAAAVFHPVEWRMSKLATRMLATTLVDYSWFSKRICYMAGLAAVAASILAFSLVWDMRLVVVVLGVWGAGVGASHSLALLISVSYVDVERSMDYISVSGLTCGLWLLGSGPVLGYPEGRNQVTEIGHQQSLFNTSQGPATQVTYVQDQRCNKANEYPAVTDEGRRWSENEEVEKRSEGKPGNTEAGVGEPDVGAGDAALISGTDKDTHREQDPPDGGWGYVVLLGVFFNMIISAGAGLNFGILYSDFLLNLGTSSTTVSMLYNVSLCLVNMAHTLAAPLVELMGWRKLALVGALLTSLGVSLSAFASSVTVLFFSVSLVTGVGTGTIIFVSNAIFPRYFKKHLGKAGAVFNGGLSLGGILAPPLVTFLQEEFGYQGATLLVGGITLNLFISAMIFHPVEWHMSKQSTAVVKQTKGKQLTKAVFAEKLRKLPCALAKNFLVLKSPQVIVLTTSATVMVSGYMQFSALVPFVMKMRDFTQADASWCLSVANICNLFTRLVAPALTDYSWFSLRVSIMAGLATVAASVLAFSLLWDLKWLVVVMGLWGVGIGVCQGLVYLLAISYVGRELSVYYLGVSGFTCGLWLLGCGPVYGAITDATGSYTVSLYILAASVAISLIPWFVPLGTNRYQTSQEIRC